MLRFPNPVNEISARLVAAGVALTAIAALALRQPWLAAPLAYGFVARVAAGPTLSPLALLVTRVVTPRLPVEPRWVAGPPKRFAQAIGATFTVTATVLHFGFGLTTAAYGLLAALALAAVLESVFGLCLGCVAFGVLVRHGAIPDDVCERCSDIWLERPSSAPV